ncbi:hypothetical protein KC640_01985, partial [Candidatus Dojkabacteria bacterium]|nr:hypothetical protein [Candidatus Dojkabacteria bacterium]
VIDSFTGVYLDGLIEDAISTLPVCSPSMQVDLTQELDCIPPGISAADLKQQLPTEIVSPDYIYSQLATYMPFLNSESENVPIAEVIPELVQEGEVAPWVQVRDVYSWLKVGMLIGWGVNLLLLILF